MRKKAANSTELDLAKATVESTDSDLRNGYCLRLFKSQRVMHWGRWPSTDT